MPYETAEGRFTRDFYAPPQSELTDEDIANAIGDYISCMDSCIQLYFDNAAEPETAARKVSEMYERYLKKALSFFKRWAVHSACCEHISF